MKINANTPLDDLHRTHLSVGVYNALKAANINVLGQIKTLWFKNGRCIMGKYRNLGPKNLREIIDVAFKSGVVSKQEVDSLEALYTTPLKEEIPPEVANIKLKSLNWSKNTKTVLQFMPKRSKALLRLHPGYTIDTIWDGMDVYDLFFLFTQFTYTKKLVFVAHYKNSNYAKLNGIYEDAFDEITKYIEDLELFYLYFP